MCCTVVVGGGLVTSVVTTQGTDILLQTISNAQMIVAVQLILAGAELDVIIPPKGGHGANAQEELVYFVMMNTSLEGQQNHNSGDFSRYKRLQKNCIIQKYTKSNSRKF